MSIRGNDLVCTQPAGGVQCSLCINNDVILRARGRGGIKNVSKPACILNQMLPKSYEWPIISGRKVQEHFVNLIILFQCVGQNDFPMENVLYYESRIWLR